MINKSNYEAFALDYLEGNLSATDRQAMEVFLQKNPEIAAELAMMGDMVTLVPDETVVFDRKNLLLKSEGGTRVVMMHQRRWFRVAMAAAAMLLLVGGYLAGYFTGEVNDNSGEIVDAPKVEMKKETVEELEKWKEEETLVIDEVTTQKENVNMPTPAEIQNETVVKKAVATEKGISKNDASVAVNLTKNIEKITPKQSISPKILVKENEQKQEEPVVVIEEQKPIAPKKTPQPILIPEKEITTPMLPEEAIVINEIPKTDTIEMESENLPEAVAINEGNPTENEALEEGNGKKTLRRISRFLGKLPFEGATASLIPTYYSDKIAGK